MDNPKPANNPKLCMFDFRIKYRLFFYTRFIFHVYAGIQTGRNKFSISGLQGKNANFLYSKPSIVYSMPIFSTSSLSILPLDNLHASHIMTHFFACMFSFFMALHMLLPLPGKFLSQTCQPGGFMLILQDSAQ